MGPDGGYGMGQGPSVEQGMGHMTVMPQTPGIGHTTVMSVQRRLNDLGYHAGPVDGVAGPRTRAAISAYQDHEGMTPTGMLSHDLVDQLMSTE